MPVRPMHDGTGCFLYHVQTEAQEACGFDRRSTWANPAFETAAERRRSACLPALAACWRGNAGEGINVRLNVSAREGQGVEM